MHVSPRAGTQASAMKTQLVPSGYDTLTLDGGWSTSTSAHVPDQGLAATLGAQQQILDEFGRPLPDPARFPAGMASLSKALKAMSITLGLWNIRGVHIMVQYITHDKDEDRAVCFKTTPTNRDLRCVLHPSTGESQVLGAKHVSNPELREKKV